MKKKIISKIVLFAAIAVLVFGLAACGSANLENSKYLGVWQAVEASDGDKVIKVGEGEDSEVNMLLNFQSDGKVVVSANGKQGKGNWKEKAREKDNVDRQREHFSCSRCFFARWSLGRAGIDLFSAQWKKGAEAISVTSIVHAYGIL